MTQQYQLQLVKRSKTLLGHFTKQFFTWLCPFLNLVSLEKTWYELLTLTCNQSYLLGQFEAWWALDRSRF